MTAGISAVLKPHTKDLGDFEVRRLLGGEAMDGDRIIWWNFVASSQAMIDEAKTRWREQRFPPVPGESDFIPLPDQ